MKVFLTFFAFLFFFLSGCAELNSIHVNGSVAPNKAIFIDAKQRAVWSVKKTDKSTVVCAEPSPDALSVISSNLGLTASKDEIQAAFNAAVAEGASTIGIRTTSIQLLRDAMYRACEAYAAGGLNRNEYQRLSKRYQKSMVTLLAIEQLTTTVYPPTVTLESTSNNEFNKNISEVNQSRIAARDAVDQITQELKVAQNEDETNDTVVKDAKQKVETAEMAVKDQSVTCDSDPSKSVCVALEEAKKNQSEAEKEKTKSESKVNSMIAKKKNAEDDLKSWEKVFSQMKEPSRDVAVEASATPNTRVVNQADISKVAGTIREMVKDVHRAEIIEVCFDTGLVDVLVAIKKEQKEIEDLNNEIKTNSKKFKILDEEEALNALADVEKLQGEVKRKATSLDAIIKRYDNQTDWCNDHVGALLAK